LEAINGRIHNQPDSRYTIPEDHWFAGSLLLDFTNPEAVDWWFEKRKYLLTLGVDGFKTDGGEFILSDDVVAANGCTGLEMRNGYAASYIKAYSRFVGKDRVLFSRAGYKGQQKYPIQWAGDQMSTWEEFHHILSAGLSIGLSGVPFWRVAIRLLLYIDY
jgi:alpha-D-xyloside xylohydrolase